MPDIKLPFPEMGNNDKETMQNLIDIMVKYRKELLFVLFNLDKDNIPKLEQIIGDIEGNNTRITQTEEDITLLAEDVAGNSASINVNAEAITSKVSSEDYTRDVIVSMINQTAETVSILAQNIDLVNATTGSSDGLDYVTIRKNYLEFVDVTGTGETKTESTKLALGFRSLDGTTTTEPVLILGAGDGTGNNIGYISKDLDSLDLTYRDTDGVNHKLSVSSAGVSISGNKLATESYVDSALSSITVTAKFG